MKDYQSAKKSYKEETKAVSEYTKRRGETKSEGLKKAYSHAIPEEKTHAKLFSKEMSKKRKYSDDAMREASKARGGGGSY